MPDAENDPPWFLATCVDCEPLLPQPFRVEAERDAWATAHASTGHRIVKNTGHVSPPGTGGTDAGHDR